MLFNHAIVAKGMHVTAVGGGGNCFSFGTHFDAMATVIELPAEEFDEETEGAYASSLLVPGRGVGAVLMGCRFALFLFLFSSSLFPNTHLIPHDNLTIAFRTNSRESEQAFHRRL
jgi:hypothetical protein